jgi:hypothetical protein
MKTPLMMNTTRIGLIGCLLGSFAAPALAGNADDVPPVTNAPDGQYAVIRGIQGPAGMVSARVLLDMNLSAGLAGQPVSLAPDIYYSATDKLQFGLLHEGPMGWQARPGVGICFTGKDNGCPHVYDNVGFDAMYGLAYGKLHLSAHGSLFVNSFDTGSTSLAVGLAGKAHLSEKVAVFFDPKVAIALSERDTTNDDALYIPLELEFQVAVPTTLKLLTGLSGGFTDFGDNYQIPFGIGLVQNLNKNFDLGARFSFDNLLGHQVDGVSATDTRSLAILLNIRS